MHKNAFARLVCIISTLLLPFIISFTSAQVASDTSTQAASNTSPRVASIQPEKPVWNQPVTVIYNPRSVVAKFTLEDEVYVVANLPQANKPRYVARMNRVDGVFKHQLIINVPVPYASFSFMLDEEKELREFLKITRFAYHIIPNADDVTISKFNVSSFPTHIIVDANGNIVTRTTGGSDKADEDLRRVIDRVLD